MADDGFTKEERAAMKQRAAELRVEAKRQKLADKAAAEEADALAAIAAMTDVERPIAQMVHEIVAEHAPSLRPKTWYGFPAYAREDGKAVVFFQPGAKFGTRYSTLGFQDGAQLDDGVMWPTAYAVTGVDDATRASLGALVRRAAGD
ncbi:MULTISPECIES: hypothetical protein [Frigoribacterium]|jgi:uncharacterized protein YdhG (YjbR/CyaY superfamily)|uniref:hypothetical protein n=1 Tax=Frigoribacterium TaxID=96492 RepID=UPI0014244737|nr:MULTISPECIES: hypothetical protein [Frigoribacterium]MBD8658632.1 hypothetical protein [Frigoribacterium sp. CFBP 8754]MBD8728500.1 hypothetical protein [Frigoribacterium sp. CFBP 13707]NII49825.1 uncharacterized protein YdhG (YjbR/CyaY superfamily) [Frigoribacterium endophyticum]QNE44487.1 hypothetical protein F1C15_12270 [Frigoribacterium sp. NBH87]